MTETETQESEATGAGVTAGDIVDLVRPGAGLDLPADAEPLDYHDGVRAALAMLHAGEIDRLQFFELCYEAVVGDDPAWVRLGASA